ncbi:MAG: glutathione peroxidase [Bacteroidia bacterium]|nr:glutathione peroxidase [Bacteroidia bacterium]
MKKIFFFMFMFSVLIINAQTGNFYDFTVKTIDGNDFSLSSLKGKKVLVVNTASKCGFTPQYEALESLFKKYGGDKFVIIGFPANNFLSQEPGTNAEIKEFCTKNYGVTFQMMEKISVKGNDIHPLYKWLTEKESNGVIDAPVKWNFQKFMIDENGKIVDFASPKEKPDCDKIVNWITGK